MTLTIGFKKEKIGVPPQMENRAEPGKSSI